MHQPKEQQTSSQCLVDRGALEKCGSSAGIFQRTNPLVAAWTLGPEWHVCTEEAAFFSSPFLCRLCSSSLALRREWRATSTRATDQTGCQGPAWNPHLRAELGQGAERSTERLREERWSRHEKLSLQGSNESYVFGHSASSDFGYVLVTVRKIIFGPRFWTPYADSQL